MKPTTFLLVILSASSWLVGAVYGEEQVILNPFVKGTSLQKSTKIATNKPTKSPQPRPSSSATAAKQTSPSFQRLQAKFEIEDALSDLYRTNSNLAQRGRIWAETKEEWTDIRIVESNLSKAADLFAKGERHWDAGRFEDWRRAWSQAADALERSRPQSIRIEHMIHVRRSR